MCKIKSDSSKDKKRGKVSMVADSGADSISASDTKSDVCHISATNGKQAYVTCYTGGVELDWVIDSGAHVNVISRATWKELKEKGCHYTSAKKPQNALRVYGDGELRIYKVIQTDIASQSKKVNHQIYVVDQQKGVNLLSKQTLIDLGVLEIRGEVFNVSQRRKMMVGKLKGVQIDVKIDKTVTPVQQPCRRLPIPLQKPVEDKLEELLQQDIIEPAPLRITWASSLVDAKEEEKVFACASICDKRIKPSFQIDIHYRRSRKSCHI